MKKLKTGEFVLDHGKLKQITFVNDFVIQLDNSEPFIPLNSEYYKFIIPWLPKEGEWCWSKWEHSPTPDLIKFSQELFDFFSSSTEFEVFVGTLPTFIAVEE